MKSIMPKKGPPGTQVIPCGAGCAGRRGKLRRSLVSGAARYWPTPALDSLQRK